MSETEKHEYEIEEWSVDTRKWVMTSDKQLTEEQVMNLFLDSVGMDEGETQILADGISVCYHGTYYGDNSEVELIGDFAEEEEE